MLGGHAAVLWRAAGSITVLDWTLLRARQMACACLARSRVHGQGHGRSSRKRARQACGPLPHVARVGSERVRRQRQPRLQPRRTANSALRAAPLAVPPRRARS
eukprot:1655505-Prymnesium_polylepis.1